MWSKITLNLKFRKLRIFDFRILFFCYVDTRTYVIYVDSISHFGLSVCFWQIKRLVCVLVCFSIFFYSQKMAQRRCIKFFEKMKLNVQEHLKWYVSSYDLFFSKSGSLLNVINIAWAMSMRPCLCSKFSNFGTIFAASCFIA